MDMPAGNNLPNSRIMPSRRALAYAVGALLAVFTLVCAQIGLAPSVSAAGEERTISFYNIHNKETITVVYKKDGRYIPSAMEQLNHFMRDWRRNTPTKMDPKLIDLIWEMRRELGSTEPTHLISGYRSPKTNAMLRRIGRRVARRSMHMLGQASDIYFPDVPLEKLRNSALVRQIGGVGYYPRSGEFGFVHVDTGKVRHWPRMSQTKLASIFRNHKKELKHRPRDNKKGPIYLVQRNRAKDSTSVAASANNIARTKTAQAFPLPRPKPAAPPVVVETVTANAALPAPVTPKKVTAKQKPVVLASVDPTFNEAEPEEQEAPKLRRSLVFFPLAILKREQRAEQIEPDLQDEPIGLHQVPTVTASAAQSMNFMLVDDRPSPSMSASQMARVARQVVARESKGRLLMTSQERPATTVAAKSEPLTTEATVIDLRSPSVAETIPSDVEERVSDLQESAQTEETDLAGEVPVAIPVPAGANLSLR